MNEWGEPWVYSEFADRAHDGIPPTRDEGNRETKLRYWRKDQYLPRKQRIIKNILTALFGKEEYLAQWRRDLEESLNRGIQAKSRALGFYVPRLPVPVRMPKPTPYFTGRSDVLSALASTLAPSTEIITGKGSSLPIGTSVLIYGGPGIGKTELTKAIAHHPIVRERYEDRRFFIRMEGADTVAALRDAIATAIDATPGEDLKSEIARVVRDPTLFVLDNLETPWAHSSERALLAEVLGELEGIAGLSLLASFRGREDVGGIRWTKRHELKPLERHESVQLISAIAGDWIETDKHLDRFLEVLGGLPLAIDLVARRAVARTSLYPLWREWQRIGAELASSFDESPTRVSSLPISIRLSLESARISDEGRELFALLGVLPNGVHEEDCEILVGRRMYSATEQLLRAGLADQNVEVVTLIPPIKEYAKRLIGEHDSTFDKAVEYFSDTKLSHRAAYLSNDADCYLGSEIAQFSNTEFALNIRISRGDIDFLGDNIIEIYSVCDLLGIGDKMLSSMERIFLKAGRHDYQAECLRHMGFLRGFAPSRPDIVIEHLKKAIDICEIHNVGTLEGSIRRSISLFLEPEEAICHLNRAAEIYSDHGLKGAQASCLINIAKEYKKDEMYDKARSKFEEAFDLYVESMNLPEAFYSLVGMGDMLYSMSDFPSCRQAMLDSLELSENVDLTLCLEGDFDLESSMSLCYERLGDLEKLDGNDASALKYYRMSLDYERVDAAGFGLLEQNVRRKIGGILGNPALKRY